MASKKTSAPPPQLNDRQRQYLLAAYQLDQQLENAHKHDYHRGVIIPAHEWRGMPYGRWQHFLTTPPTPLRELIEKAQKESKRRLVDPGSGSTWKALADRGLVEVEDRIVFPGPDEYSLPHVLMTAAGRKLMRQLTGEVRPKAPPRKPKPQQPEGLLSAQVWLALAYLYRVDYEGLPVDDVLSPAPTFSRLSFHIFWILRERGLAIGSPDEQLHAEKYTITERGREYYAKYYRVNVAAYYRKGKDEIPRLILTPEQRAFWQCSQELNTKVNFAGPVQEIRNAARREALRHQLNGSVGALCFDGMWYMTLEGVAIPINSQEDPIDYPFSTEAEALERVKQKVEGWEKQLSWLEPATESNG